MRSVRELPADIHDGDKVASPASRSDDMRTLSISRKIITTGSRRCRHPWSAHLGTTVERESQMRRRTSRAADTRTPSLPRRRRRGRRTRASRGDAAAKTRARCPFQEKSLPRAWGRRRLKRYLRLQRRPPAILYPASPSRQRRHPHKWSRRRRRTLCDDGGKREGV